MANKYEAELEEPMDFSNLYRLEFVENGADDEVILFKVNKKSSELPFLNGTFRRRRSFRSSHQPISGGDYRKDSNCNSFAVSEVDNQISDRMTFNHKERKNNIVCTFDEDEEKVSQIGSSSSSSDSPRNFQLISNIIDNETKQNYEIPSFQNTNSHHFSNHKLDEFSLLSYFVELIAGLVIKAIGLQFNLFVSFFTFPIWFMYCSFLFVTNPFGFFKWIIKRTTQKLLNFGGGIVPCVFERLTGDKSIGKLVIRLSWGIFWSFYVSMVLFGILLSGFVIGGIVMRCIVEEPIKTTEILNFDYTKSTPVAFVPIMGCPISAPCNGSDCEEDEKLEVGNYIVGSSPIIPPHHKLKLTISLTMPESDYNRKLGIFQVRVDFLSATGKVTASSRYPCMLRFKSHLIRYLGTFIKSLPLLAGYSSESQTLDLEMRSTNEENEPTSCLKVILEQRAEYKPGAGIPEIYAASMVLESELPLYKRLIWNWRKTLFVWTSIISFMTELLMILLCCRPIILPRAKPRLFAAGSAKKIAAADNVALIKGC